MPIDFTTNDFGMSLGYTGEKSSLKAAYTGSLFKDNIKSLTFDDAFYYFGLASGSATTVFPNTGRFSTAPDNQYHQLTLSGTHKFSATTKLVGDLAYGRGTQNDGFLPYNTGGALAPLHVKAQAQGSGDFSAMWAGQAAALGREIPARELTAKLANETQALLRRMAG